MRRWWARLSALSPSGLRRLLVALAALTLVHSTIAIWITATADKDHDLVLELVAVMAVGWGFAGTGLFAWWRRPANPVGALMWLTGFFWFFNVYSLSDAAVPFALGYLLTSISFGCLIHLLLVFPDGRLRTRLERTVVAGGYFVVIVMQFAGGLLVDPERDGCDDCRENPLLVIDDAGVQNAYSAVQSLLAIAVLVGLVVALVRRWRAWPPARRRLFAPVLWAGGISLSVLSVMLAIDVAGVSESLRQAVFLVALVPFAAIPFAFLAGLLRSRISRAEAVSDLVAGLAASPEGGDLRDALAEAISDPSVELVYWVPETDSYVNAKGAQVGLPGLDHEREWAEVTHDGERVGAILYDGVSEDAGETVAMIASAAGLRMENERLAAELRARLEELRASRARIVEAGYRERRRVERDLHDGAQQRLLALALNLKLARSKLDESPVEAAELLDQATGELEQATAELRELARGIHPGLLTDRGLVPALEALASRATVPVELTAVLPQRPAAGVEAATYFLVSEALANVTRHAQAQNAVVSVTQLNGSLAVEVMDDGSGGADPSGSGLTGIADRVAALDGVFSVVDRDEGGTIVRASIPLG